MSPAPPTRAAVIDSAGDSGEAAVLAAIGERLRVERDRAICGAHHHGLPIASIARMMKMSDQDVSQIIAG